jgi:iron(II)-dependent oxidoreductase
MCPVLVRPASDAEMSAKYDSFDLAKVTRPCEQDYDRRLSLTTSFLARPIALSPLDSKNMVTTQALFLMLALSAFSAMIQAQTTAVDASSLTTMAFIAEGPYVMGSNDGPDDEKPEHRIFVKAFLMDVLPVSNTDFAKFLNARGLKNHLGESFYDDDDRDARIHKQNSLWQADPGYATHPVNEVSWLGARDYCAWLKKRLPTEAEWEKAARGTDGRKYPWGNTKPERKQALFGSTYNSSAPVDAFPSGASPFGVLDLSGNQWEWVSSAYRPYPYSADDGRENQTPGPVRSTRGGGHDSSEDEITTTQRGRNLSRSPNAGHHNIGFRCATDHK